MKRVLFFILLFSPIVTTYAQSDRGLAKLIAQDLSIDQELAFQVIKSFKHHTIDTLRNGKIVRLQGLGRFYVEHETAKPNGNLQTGETRPIPAKNYLRFKASKVGNQSLN